MSRAKCNLLIACATVLPLVALTSSAASAFGRGGFGFHPGFGGYGVLPYGGYGAPAPAYVVAPSVYDPGHAAKNREKNKNKEVKLHQHHNWHGAERPTGVSSRLPFSALRPRPPPPWHPRPPHVSPRSTLRTAVSCSRTPAPRNPHRYQDRHRRPPRPHRSRQRPGLRRASGLNQ